MDVVDLQRQMLGTHAVGSERFGKLVIPRAQTGLKPPLDFVLRQGGGPLAGQQACLVVGQKAESAL